MTLGTGIRDEDLHALLDGELDEATRARVEAVVQANAQLRDRLARYRADKERLRTLYGGADEALPAAWIARIESACARQRPRWRDRPLAGVLALAASFVLVLCGVIAWRLSQPVAAGDVVAEALAARDGTESPATRILAPSPRTLVAVNGEMSRALDARVHAPDLARMGYRLVGIEEYAAPARAFELRYADVRGGIFTLYLRRSSGVPRFDQFPRDGLRVCVWQDDVIGMVMAGKVSVPVMQRLASLAYTGLEM